MGIFIVDTKMNMTLHHWLNIHCNQSQCLVHFLKILPRKKNRFWNSKLHTMVAVMMSMIWSGLKTTWTLSSCRPGVNTNCFLSCTSCGLACLANFPIRGTRCLLDKKHIRPPCLNELLIATWNFFELFKSLVLKEASLKRNLRMKLITFTQKYIYIIY